MHEFVDNFFVYYITLNYKSLCTNLIIRMIKILVVNLLLLLLLYNRRKQENVALVNNN